MLTTTTPTVNLGNCKPNSYNNFTFNITNNSIETLTLEVKASCGCTKPVLDKTTMGPFEMQFGKAEIHLNSNKGTFTKHLTITDQLKNIVKIKITGNVI